MASLFDRYHWSPIRQGYYPQSQVRPHSVKPKVINVPVQFIGNGDRNSEMSPAMPKAAAVVVPSEEARVSAAATIQRIVRGFMVRKNAQVVRQVAAEVDEIERNIKEHESKICLDARERLRANEALMVLLLRLDSVRGARDFRKKVIRRIIALQETIDSISTSADGTICAIGIGEDGEDSSNEAADESAVDNERAEDQTLVPAVVESSNRENVLVEPGVGTISTNGMEDDLKDLMTETADKSSINHEDQTLELEENEAAADTEIKIQAVYESPERGSRAIAEEIPFRLSPSMSESLPGEKVEEGIGMRKLIERMAAENGRLKEMVEQLCATRAEQCRLMEGLADRVENLERFVHRMDRRRKRRGPACSAISSAK